MGDLQALMSITCCYRRVGQLEMESGGLWVLFARSNRNSRSLSLIQQKLRPSETGRPFDPKAPMCWGETQQRRG
jgi:hypothetical protein